MEKHQLFLILLLFQSCLDLNHTEQNRLIQIKNIKPLEVFVENKLNVSQKDIEEKKNFIPIIIYGGEGNIDIKVIDGPGEISSTNKHKYIFRSKFSGESTLKISDGLGQTIKRVITTNTKFKIKLDKKYISRTSGKINQVHLRTVGGKGRSIIKLRNSSLGSVVNNKIYIPPTSPALFKEKIEFVAIDDDGNKAFES